MTNSTGTGNEISLSEMFADPIVQTVMERDGVTVRELEDLVTILRIKWHAEERNEHGIGLFKSRFVVLRKP